MTILSTQKKQKLDPIPESVEKKSDAAGSENTAPEVSPFAKPLSIPGIHFGRATDFTELFVMLLLCTIGFI